MTYAEFLNIDDALAAMDLVQKISEQQAEIERASRVIATWESKTYKHNDVKLKGQKYTIGEINTRRRNRVLNIEYMMLDAATAAKAKFEAQLKSLMLYAVPIVEKKPDFDPFALFDD